MVTLAKRKKRALASKNETQRKTYNDDVVEVVENRRLHTACILVASKHGAINPQQASRRWNGTKQDVILFFDKIHL
jgi:hypothetical protein